MKSYSLKPVYLLLSLLVLVSSCKGQVSTQPPQILKEPAKIGAGLPKIRKTQGSNEYQNVHCGLQDKKGNIWFGTTGEGVYRYDGKLFTQFTIEDGLSSNTVWSVLEDTKGNMWFGTDAGLCCFDVVLLSTFSFSLLMASVYTQEASPLKIQYGA